MSRSAIHPFFGALLLGALSLVLVSSVSGARNPQVVKDDLGHEFRLGAPPRRIVSLAPNVTEILFALRLGENVVGVTRYCDFPAEASAVEKIGGLADPDLEKIQSLEPDLVLAYRGNPLEAVRKLRDLGLPVFVLDAGSKMEHLPALVSRIGAVTGKQTEAEALALRLKKDMDGVRNRLDRCASRVRAFLLLSGEGLWTCGSQSYVHDILDQASAVNVAAGIRRSWAPFSVEGLLAEDPDVLILMAGSRKVFGETASRIKNDPRLRHLKAVRRNRLVPLDENKASRFGPRLVEAFAELARALHPECFPPNASPRPRRNSGGSPYNARRHEAAPEKWRRLSY
ncbi:MAG: ABC transporter substrate-binding protein [Candidatus Aminicenantes bacterium]|nr:ABC transporter substrate-binding protein [Candidatus Aminicenantes bacterium]